MGIDDVFLLYAKKSTVSAIWLNRSNTKDAMIPVRQLKTAVGVDFSFEDQYVYWSDITADAISRVFLNGSGQENLVFDGNYFVISSLLSAQVKLEPKSSLSHDSSLSQVQKRFFLYVLCLISE